jgi:5,10-methylene-tetrahydrofolate dehydrogenase/methenyl tetrahydrofolate cyclohydrolase
LWHKQEIIVDVSANQGDVDCASVREVAGALTPTPGGVGSLTAIVLLKQCVEAARPEVDEAASIISR